MVPLAAIKSNSELQITRIDIGSFFIGITSSFLEKYLLKKVETTATRPVAIKRIEPFTPFGLNPRTDI
jgi:hypothetical protein